MLKMEGKETRTNQKPDLTSQGMSESSSSDMEDDDLLGKQGEEIHFSPNGDEDKLNGNVRVLISLK